MQVERVLRQVHGWLGILVLPWVLIIGLTGLYMNHSRLVLSWLPESSAAVPSFAALPGARKVNVAAALVIARRVWPETVFGISGDDSYRGRDVFTLEGETGDVIVDRATGLFWTRTDYVIAVHDPTGAQIGSEIRWRRILRMLHTDGWLGGALGSWPVDIAAAALVGFALSGLVLFVAPRLRRRSNRARAAALRRAAQQG